jgi:23S rRNA (cytidine1920-2'-O)/16S rRNA (cytidine1409-2'-O)-methyltransferase
VDKEYVDSRNIAKDSILKGLVEVDGTVITKPSHSISDDSLVEIKDEKIYVSRASYKLKGFLKYLDIDISNSLALDIGSSRGGFVEVLLENGVKKVVCVDVGTNQLHPKLKAKREIEFYENQDIRDFFYNYRFDIVTCDVSFISILNILDSINRLANDKIIILFKPQFEVGKDVKRDKKGVVLDKNSIELARSRVLEECLKLDWRLMDSKESILSGKEGNIEELFYFRK